MTWEDKCHKCGLCCMHKVYIEGNSGPVRYLGTGCDYLMKSGQCAVYDDRFTVHPKCVKLTPEVVAQVDWLPESCGYKNDDRTAADNQQDYAHARREGLPEGNP